MTRLECVGKRPVAPNLNSYSQYMEDWHPKLLCFKFI